MTMQHHCVLLVMQITVTTRTREKNYAKCEIGGLSGLSICSSHQPDWIHLLKKSIHLFYLSKRTNSAGLKLGPMPSRWESMINLTAMINKIKHQPRYPEVGMIVCHNGVVRGTSRNGQPVSAIEVAVDRNRLKEVLTAYKQRPGIVDISVEIVEGTLRVGEDIMAVVVAGNTRKNVFPVLEQVVDVIKRDVVKKTERNFR